MHGQFIREIPMKVDKDRTWQWLCKSNSKIGTEALLCPGRTDIRSNYVKHHIDKTSENPLCRLCGKNGESVQNFVSGCEKFAQREYKR